MECPTCKAEAADGSKFCTQCGARLPLACTACGQAVPATAKYCGNCGNKLTAASPEPLSGTPPAPPVQAAARRQLTVMFCDLVGSTALAARLDPEDMREVIGAYQDGCAGMIARFEGHIARLVGDGVLAYFGYPVAHEDAAERAVRAALGLVATIGKLPLRHDVSLQVRIGVATGMVVIGDLAGAGKGSLFEEVVGQTPALAARLQTIAAPNQVIISASTHRLIGGLFDCLDAGRLDLKGFAQPVQAWRVVGEARVQGRFEAMHQTALTGLVGREREIELLVDRWALAASREGQVVLLSGEPGIGKSRISEEFQRRIAGEKHRRIFFSCSPHHQNSAFYPIITQLEHSAGFHRDDTPEAKLEKLGTLLREAGNDVPDALPLFAALLGLPADEGAPVRALGAEQQKKRTLAALLAQVEARAAREPVLLIFEDVQWLDPTTSEFLDLVIERIETLPVLLMITHRADFTPPWTGYEHDAALAQPPQPGAERGDGGAHHRRQADPARALRADRRQDRRDPALRRGADQGGAGIGHPCRGFRPLRPRRPAAAARDPGDAAGLAAGAPRPPQPGEGGGADGGGDRPRVHLRAARRDRADEGGGARPGARRADAVGTDLRARHAAGDGLRVQARAGAGDRLRDIAA
jgi:class 3 adenylate cyclase